MKPTLDNIYVCWVINQHLSPVCRENDPYSPTKLLPLYGLQSTTKLIS